VIPAAHTLIVVDSELEGAASWAARHGAKIEWLPEALELRVTLLQPETSTRFFLRGRFRDYRALPPEWTFTDEKWGATGRPGDFPKGVRSSFGATIFIMHKESGVICAPFNRLAYTDHAGPHGNWGGPANWLNAGPSQVHADTIGDMLQAVHRDFLLTRERMAPL
jgi:hypothetical protein